MPPMYLHLPAFPSPVDIDDAAAEILTEFVIYTIQLHPIRARDDTGAEKATVAAGEAINSSTVNDEDNKASGEGGDSGGQVAVDGESKGARESAEGEDGTEKAGAEGEGNGARGMVEGEGEGEDRGESAKGGDGGGEEAAEGEGKGARRTVDGAVAMDGLDGTKLMKKFHALLRGVSPFLCVDSLFLQLLRFLQAESLLCAEEADVWMEYYMFLSRRRKMSTAMSEVASTLSRIRGVNEARARARAKQVAEGGAQADAEMADADLLLRVREERTRERSERVSDWAKVANGRWRESSYRSTISSYTDSSGP
ncbi:hypothetical protein GSI_09850 [Ganoderma sinense ZZ0214-1]|uniref:Uncharacterized protein n=1 Tax=Ganoderma sinense ZZ0214-1 TaxID=1077348 RepID=A0A2G8S2J7_9APHY|nr:hypothetical protein GSI_09850 [Ganoderma sinense ZZ0214-1]